MNYLSNIFRFVVFMIMMIPSLMTQSQTISTLSRCDTINIDECYIVYNGSRCSVDTNVHEMIDGYFEIVRIIPISLECYLLTMAQKDTIYTIYDSVLIDGKQTYSVDTFYTTIDYNVWVEDVETLNDSLKNYVKCPDNWERYDEYESFSLSIRSFYNEFKLPHNAKVSNDKLASTVDCSQCYVIVLHGKKKKIFDCPLFNNLYRLN